MQTTHTKVTPQRYFPATELSHPTLNLLHQRSFQLSHYHNVHQKLDQTHIMNILLSLLCWFHAQMTRPN